MEQPLRNRASGFVSSRAGIHLGSWQRNMPLVPSFLLAQAVYFGPVSVKHVRDHPRRKKLFNCVPAEHQGSLQLADLVIDPNLRGEAKSEADIFGKSGPLRESDVRSEKARKNGQRP